MDTSYRIKDESTFDLLVTSRLDKYQRDAVGQPIRREFNQAIHLRKGVYLFALTTIVALILVGIAHIDKNSLALRYFSITASAFSGVLTLVAFRYFFHKVYSLRETPPNFTHPCYWPFLLC